MSCSHPLKAWSTGLKTETGKPLYYITRSRARLVRLEDASSSLGVSIPFDARFIAAHDGQLYLKKSIDIPCGRCAGCLSNRVRDWSVRLMLENDCHDSSYFVTLTYDDQHLVPDSDSVKHDVSSFVKRLRSSTGQFLRYFACVEHGSTTGRLHAHIILFGLKLDDLVLWSSGENPLYTSEVISHAWKKGNCLIGSVTPASCAYVSRYCVKKIRELDDSCTLMSRRPGIGQFFFLENRDKILRTDTIYFPFSDSMHTARVPRYFDKLLEKDVGLDGVKDLRHLNSILKRNLDIGISGSSSEDELLEYYDSLESRKERRLQKARGL